MSESVKAIFAKCLTTGIPDPLPPPLTHRDPSIAHAPKRNPNLSPSDFRLAISNHLRYFPSKHHALLAREFARELAEYGHIYMYRLMPVEYAMRAYPIETYPCVSVHAAAMILNIMNNLDPAVAQFPHELITYGGNGTVFSHWAQYRLTIFYLTRLTNEQTLVMMSGHPQGIFPSDAESPRCVITNGMVIPNYSSKEEYARLHALNVTMYGQMTAGSWAYIGPQGIIHGTTITILNAGRKYLGLPSLDRSGTVYVSSGLGGMSGAQPKAARITGCIGVIAEIDGRAIEKRFKQGWVDEIIADLDVLIARVRRAKKAKESVSIAYHGNIVDLWERLADLDEKPGECLVELGSDQTSLHNPFQGGYYPIGLTFDESNAMMNENPSKFKKYVEMSLRRHVDAINKMARKGCHFWDYGNSFLLEASRAKADVMMKNEHGDGYKFKYPSYVQDIMGPAIFSLGFGPFRWVCTSGKEKDLRKTDEIATRVFEEMCAKETEGRVLGQLNDNLHWIKNAFANKMVVGSQSRILYADARGRMKIAKAFNEAIASGEIEKPVILSRDHHDVSGTDSPYRETSNIYDGSSFTADMAVQNFVGDSFRGATWVALHNGGGVGWGEVINGGFGLVLDGSKDALARSQSMLFWDVNNGIARRAWAGNDNANFQIRRAMKDDRRLQVTLAHRASKEVIENAVEQVLKSKL